MSERYKILFLALIFPKYCLLFCLTAMIIKEKRTACFMEMFLDVEGRNGWGKGRRG